MPPVGHLAMLYVSRLVDLEVIKKEVNADPYLTLILKELQEDPEGSSKFKMQQGILQYKNRLVLAKQSSLIPSILHMYHDSVMGGHSGFLRTYKRLTGELYWQGMKADIKQYVEHCQVCQRNKTLTASPAGLLQPLPIPDRIWEDIAMDFIEGLPKSGGHDTVLMVVDRLSKYANYIALSHPFTAKVVVGTFIKEIVRLHGFPRSIVSDRNKIFVSHFWTELFRVQGTQLRRSTAYQPPVRRSIRSSEPMLGNLSLMLL